MAIQSTFKCECGRKISRMYNARSFMDATSDKGFVYAAPAWDHIAGDGVLRGITCGSCGNYHEFIAAPEAAPYANVRRT